MLRRPAARSDRLPPRTIGLPPNQHTYPNGTSHRSKTGGAPTGAEVYYGLTPDGVRTITLSFRSKYANDAVTALVINNVFIVRNDRGRLGLITTETWRGPDGQTIKVIHQS